MRILVALLLLATTLAACADAPAPTATSPPAPRDTRPLAVRAAEGMPAVPLDAEQGVAWWRGFVEATPKRDLLLPNNAVARDRIAQALEAGGLQVERRDYNPPPVPGGAVTTLHVVLGVKPGAGNASRALALGAHFDTQAGTVYGAYDNGSGTAAVVHACTALANVTMDHTLLCVLFDGEEEGALGSQAFLDDVLASKEWTLDAYLGFDMVGLNWPGKDPGADGRWRLYGWVGPEHADALHPFVNDTFTHVLGYPPEGAHVFPYNDRNSDEAVFAAAGIPTVRLAGGRTAGSYPQYHLPGDTTDFVEEFAGGHDRWVAGFGAIVRTATTLTLLLDRVGLDEMQRA